MGDPVLALYDAVSLQIGCAQNPVTDIPTLSEWGLILLSILLLSYGTLIIMANNVALSGIGNIQLPIKEIYIPFSSFHFSIASVLTILLVIFGFVLSIILYGSAFTSDIIGVSFTAPVFAYFIHLLLIQNTRR